jgi:hypothetical protein
MSQYDIIKEEFNVTNYISNEKLKKYKENLLSSKDLNQHEKNFVKYRKSFYMLSYNTKNVYDLYSYYIVEFDNKCIKDIIEVRIIEEIYRVKNKGYSSLGFKFLDTVSMSKDREKEKKFKSIIDNKLKEYLKNFGDLEINFDVPDTIIEILDFNKYNQDFFF